MKLICKMLLLLLFVFTAAFNSYADFGIKNDNVKIKAFSSQTQAAPGSVIKIVAKINISETWHINSNKPKDESLVPSELVIDSAEGFKAVKIYFPKAEDKKLEISATPVSVFEKEIYIGAEIKVPDNVKKSEYRIPVTFNFQACNNQTCLPPDGVTDTLVVAIGNNTVAVNADIISKAPFNNDAQVKTDGNGDSISSTLEKSGLFLGLFFIFLGGLALNLTPCVYPLIPITIGYFGGQAEGKTGRLFLLGVLYVLGIAITYSIVGVVTSLSGAVFGTLLQKPLVIIFIALIFIVLALSQFGVYEFKLPDSWVAKAGGAKSGTFGAFFMGLTMGIVAAPCIGPFVLGLVTYVAAKGDPVLGFFMFFVLALGLGFPYLILALFSGKIKSLPRAGIWMEGVKHVFGFLLIGMAFYFAGPLLPKEINRFLLPVYGIIVAVILLFFDKTAKNVKGFKTFKYIFSIIVIAVSVYALVPSKVSGPEWKRFEDSGYETALNNKNKIVIDFYADWCIPCKELDANTFSNPKVAKELEQFTKFKVDMTKSASPETEKLRTRFKILGVPTVLIINANGQEDERLTGFVNADKFLELLDKAK